MDSVLYELQFSLPLLLAAAAYQLCSQFYTAKKGIKTPPLHILGVYLFCLLVGVILSITGSASLVDIYILGGEIQFQYVNIVPFKDFDAFGFVANAIMLVPFGFLLPLVFSQYRSFAKTLLAGFLFSLTIELSQLFTLRTTDINDLIMNTLGAAAGFAIFALANRALPRTTEKFVLPAGASKHEALIYMVILFAANFLLYPILLYVYYGYTLS